MYLATSEENASVVLMAERGMRQILVYFVSRTLHGAELKYPKLEKLILPLVYAARKLQRYFQAHPIQVLSDKPIKQILAKLEKLGRIAKWAIELGEREIEFRGRNSIKGKILADFLAETQLMENREAKNKEVKGKELEPENAWKLFTNGASSFDGSGACLMVVSPKGKEYTYALRFEFKITNNKAEYKAPWVGLRIAKEIEIRELIIFVDSQIVANQVKGLFEARQPTIKQYLEKMMDLLSGFPSYSIKHIKREQNKKADALSKLASMTFSKLAKEVLVEVIQNKSITEKEVADIVKEEGDNWMTPIREYLRSGALPDDPQKARKLRIKAPLYKMIEEKLYRRSYLSPWLRCVGLMQAKNIIKEVHEGSCGMHSGPRSVVSKITRLGYYWPSMHKDAKELIQKCEACQIYSSVPRKPKEELTFIMSAWPFSQRGIDIVGPLPTAPGGVRCGDSNHLLKNVKTTERQEQCAFIGGSWSDSGEEDDEKVKDETCLVAQASSEICLESRLGTVNEWIKR
ncbi:reverse transcriptase domain-containing protein [Tanacetum coccineum]|uniref:Reverse transcriptase domain-containing protein n=1 Tax=Tanacetum coccineum TaxID=301880 RepID=A0ABQ5BAU6_9ASTR